ncbi:MAG: hypothetical protein AAF645_05600 [Myxococcota bacterium]
MLNAIGCGYIDLEALNAEDADVDLAFNDGAGADVDGASGDGANGDGPNGDRGPDSAPPPDGGTPRDADPGDAEPADATLDGDAAVEDAPPDSATDASPDADMGLVIPLPPSLANSLPGADFVLHGAARAGAYVYACGEELNSGDGMIVALREGEEPVVHRIPSGGGRSACLDIVAVGGVAYAVGVQITEGFLIRLRDATASAFDVTFADQLGAIVEATTSEVTAVGLLGGELGIYRINVGSTDGSVFQSGLSGFFNVDDAVRVDDGIAVAVRTAFDTRIIMVEADSASVRWVTSLTVTEPAVVAAPIASTVSAFAGDLNYDLLASDGSLDAANSLANTRIVDVFMDGIASEGTSVGRYITPFFDPWNDVDQVRFTRSGPEVLLVDRRDSSTTLYISNEDDCDHDASTTQLPFARSLSLMRGTLTPPVTTFPIRAVPISLELGVSVALATCRPFRG